MTDDEIEASLAIIDRLGGIDAGDARDRAGVHRTVEAVRQRGYASSTGQTEAKISAIALPVRSPHGQVAGAINIVFFRAAMNTEQAADRHLDKLRSCVDEVERSLREFAERQDVAAEQRRLSAPSARRPRPRSAR